MLKKIITTMGLAGMMLLSGCSLLGEVNNTLKYANTTTEYMDSAKSFANEVPQLANDAVTNEEARQQLEAELTTMKENIQKFNETEVPSIAEDIHNQIVSTNAKLEEGIDLYLANIENGKLDPALLKDSGILTTVNEISSLMDQIKKLTN
jgi:peptidoglycan hydrolase CwlO-like protein